MGTITIKVPQNVQLEYEIDNWSVAEKLLKRFASEPLVLKGVKPNRLLGLFKEDAELLDAITADIMQTREVTPFRYHHG